MSQRPADVGILAFDLYFPTTYVDQTELEEFDGISKGKYTIGLGQLKMACVSDREDINSIALTNVQNLIEKFNINPIDIGRLEVGTETLIDKSKSIKTTLMGLFHKCGNHSIEGITTMNACYGGVQALFNTVAWMESSAWDGRYGIVVACDIAVYAQGPARCTGGAGSAAILIGPNAPITIDPLRASYMENAYDFYKPDPTTEYPTVAGQYSIDCYLRALDYCYTSLLEKRRVSHYSDLADFYVFHSPFTKMIRKAWNKLIHTDVTLNPNNHGNLGATSRQQQLDFSNKSIYEMVNNYTKESWDTCVAPGTLLGTQLGNLYTGSVFVGLMSLMDKVDIVGKKVAVFSYGSGLSSSLFTMCFKEGAGSVLEKIRAVNEIEPRLSRRIKLDPVEYTRRMNQREVDYLKNDYRTQDSIDELQPGAFYLTHVDDKWRRFYERKQMQSKL